MVRRKPLAARASRRYDVVHTQKDLEPDESQKRQGSVLLSDGAPAADAEVVLLQSDEAKTGVEFRVEVDDGQVRWPVQEIVTRTNAAGLFTVYSKQPFQLLVLHKAGFALANSDELSRESAITLKRWVRISGTIDRTGHPKQSVNFTTVLPPADRWPRILLTDFQMPVADDGSFDRGTIAAGEITVERFAPPPHFTGDARTLTVEQIRDGQPGSEHRITIRPLTETAVEEEGKTDNTAPVEVPKKVETLKK